jgi:hypothetical protein
MPVARLPELIHKHPHKQPLCDGHHLEPPRSQSMLAVWAMLAAEDVGYASKSDHERD